MQKAAIEKLLYRFEDIVKQFEETFSMAKLAREEEEHDLLNALLQDADRITAQVSDLETETLFCGPQDANNAYVDFQPGSGGEEAQDWAEMLMRMYMRWGERHGFTTESIDYSPAENAGIKSATVKFIGLHAYGWLRTESGIHRLVRKSPFDSGNRRHTSFASVFVTAEIDEKIEIVIDPASIRVDTYRASGAGGQHVNKTDSAVRITHLPSGIAVQSQNNRSQHKNRDQAMRQLRAKLYQLELQNREAEKLSMEANKPDIGWGSQIRSYVLDQSRIKDLRTGMETSNVQAFLDGDLKEFIKASLQQKV